MKELQEETAKVLLEQIKALAVHPNAGWGGLKDLAEAYAIVVSAMTGPAKSSYEGGEAMFV